MSKTIQEILAEKTLAELSLPTKQQTSRVWTDPEGYKYLVQWSNCVLLRFFVIASLFFLIAKRHMSLRGVYPTTWQSI